MIQSIMQTIWTYINTLPPEAWYAISMGFLCWLAIEWCWRLDRRWRRRYRHSNEE